MVNFNAPVEDKKKIAAIADRFIAESIYDWDGGERLTMIMSLTACHANGTPLDLDGMLNAQSVDLSHDVSGICSNINTTTGKLDSCFLPRYTHKEVVNG